MESRAHMRRVRKIAVLERRSGPLRELFFVRRSLFARVVPYAAVELDTGCCLLAASTAGTRSTLIRDFTTYPRTPVCAGSAASDLESCSVTIRISAPGNCS